MATKRNTEIALVSSENELEVVAQTLNELQNQNFRLAESLADVQLMIDARGYTPMFDFTHNGLSLQQLHLASRQLRELVVGNPVMKSGSQKRAAYVWDKGVDIEFSGASEAAKKKLGKLMGNSYNQAALFSADAQQELERCAYTDGNFFLLGDNTTKKLIRVPLAQISAVYSDPDSHENVMAIRRSWNRIIGVESTHYDEWYYLDTYDGARGNTIAKDGVLEGIDTNKTMFWLGYNRQIGWVWGIPDSLPVIAWSKLYKDFLVQGSVMSKALAQIAYKLTAKTGQGAAQASATISASTQGGQTAAMSSSMDMAPLSTAGKGYDFASGEPMAAMVAVGIDLTLQDLLGQPNTDKADGIPTATKRAMRSRQRTQASLLQRVLVWMGAPDETEVEFPEMDDTDSFRRFQTLSSALGTGLFAADEMRPEMAEVADIDLLRPEAPAGFMLPNNLTTLTDTAKANASAMPAPAAGGNPGAPKTDGSNAMSNGQGRNNQKQGNLSAGNNDLRDGTTKK